MSLPKSSSTFVRVSIAALGAAALSWLFTCPERYLQIGAGVFLLALIGWVVLSDVLCGRFRVWNIKYYVLASYAAFLGLGMLFDLGDETYFFSGYAIALTFAGLFCLLVGFLWAHRPRRGGGQQLPSFWLTQNQLFKVAVLFYLLGFGFLFVEWRLFGQLQSYSGRLVSPTGTLRPTLPMVHVWTQLVGPATLMTLVLSRRGFVLLKTSSLRFFLALTATWYLLWGNRANFLMLAVGCLIIWSEVPDASGSRRVGLKPILVLCLAAATMFALTALRAHWDFSRARAEGLSGLREQVGASLDMFRELRHTVEFFPRHVDFLYGYSFYGLVSSVVPRILWPEKPVGVGKLASILYDRNPDSSIGPSLVGELYANFGTLGSLFGMVLFGAVVGSVCRWYGRQRGDGAALVVYIQLLWSMAAEVRGDILDATYPLFYHLLPVVLVFSVVTRLNRARARRAACALPVSAV